uniref:Probasin n=1 Tax=Peromyscus maniculatus bairdii TaxID=230844 RepID=A0A8C8TCN9_PERMB
TMRVFILLLMLDLLGVSSVMMNKNLRKKIQGNWRTVYLASSTVEKISVDSPLRTYFRRIECGKRCRQIHFYFYIKKGARCQQYEVIGKKRQEFYQAQSRARKLTKDEMTQYMDLVEEIGIEDENVQRVLDTDTCP